MTTQFQELPLANSKLVIKKTSSSEGVFFFGYNIFMITHKSIRNFTKPRTFVDLYIEELKESKPNLTVIDVGGGINSWCKHTTHVVDIFVDPGSKEEFVQTHPNRKFFDFDITQRDNWKEVLDYVAENGKFDYCICTAYYRK